MTLPELFQYDVIIVGAGPGGLSSAIFAASEGLKTLLIERKYVGGQSAGSSLIENYYGFPEGISGAELADRGRKQAEKFGVQFVQGEAVKLDARGAIKMVRMADGRAFFGFAVIIASGLTFKKLGVPGEDSEGVYYGAHTEIAYRYSGRPVVVVGAGNSAGQAAQHLTSLGSKVTLLVRGDNLAASMSDYLARRVASNPNIDIRFGSQVVEFLADNGRLSGVLTNKGDVIEADACFVFVGAHPDCDWLKGVCELTDNGFIKVDDQFETSAPGVFAVGDSHEGARNRVAASVGEGSIAVRYVHDVVTAAKVALPAGRHYRAVA